MTARVVMAFAKAARRLSLALIALLVFSQQLYAAVLVVHPDSSDGASIASELVSKIPGSKASSLKNLGTIDPTSTVVALGSESLHAIPPLFKGKVVASFVSEAEFSEFRASRKDGESTALYTSPLPIAQVRLAKALLHAPRVGLIYTASTPPGVIEQYAVAAKATGLTLVTRKTDKSDVLKSVRRLISVESMDVLLIIDESDLYSSDILIPTLRLLLRYNRSAIAFGPKIVSAGAIGATFFDRESIFKSLVDLSIQVDHAAGKLPAPHYPEKIQFAINRQYLRSVYDILSIDDAQIEGAINGR